MLDAARDLECSGWVRGWPVIVRRVPSINIFVRFSRWKLDLRMIAGHRVCLEELEEINRLKLATQRTEAGMSKTVVQIFW